MEAQWCQVLIPNMSTDEQARWALFLQMSMKDEHFLLDEQQKWALFLQMSMKDEHFLLDEQ